jgi:hypothetical protein
MRSPIQLNTMQVRVIFSWHQLWRFFHDKRRAAAMMTIEVIASLIVALGTVITGIIAAARWYRRRDQQARADRAKIAAVLAEWENRAANHADGGVARKRGEGVSALIILAAAAVGWVITLRWWHPRA